MFAPLVVLVRNYLGKTQFNQLRGKAIALHAQVITAFCQRVGIETNKRQSLIRAARDNGKKLGLLV